MKVKIVMWESKKFIQISGPKEKNLIVLTIAQASETARKLQAMLLKDFGKKYPGLAKQIQEDES
jgi:hypothetical protein